ncbi:MAG TPA: hypothetical protein VMT63_07140 [Bacteroidales bacterium]|nr:hypothetical protein [Bacteroidales bacterium]
MTSQEKRLRLIESKLKGTNASAVTETITSLRNEEPCRGVIRLLAELFNSTANSLVRKKIQDFMNDMKEQSLRSEVVEEIRKDHNKETIRMLVSSCWQSGLDYSEYVSDFTMIFNKSDYETAIECFTVIEGCAPQVSRHTRDHLIVLLRENESAVSEKKALVKELVTVLR